MKNYKWLVQLNQVYRVKEKGFREDYVGKYTDMYYIKFLWIQISPLFNLTLPIYADWTNKICIN